jgi:iron complex outermembrane recepter protein
MNKPISASCAVPALVQPWRSALLQRYLSTTILAGFILSPASLALAQSAGPDASGAGGTTLPTIDVNGSGEGGRFTGYNATNANSVLKTDTPILQTPVSVQVVPRQTMDDQQAISVQDAIVSNVSGVSEATFTLPRETFTIRGFNTGTNVYINGLRQTASIGLETQNLQSIEVLKGPSAMLFGRVEAGGLVDLVLKRPLETPYYSFQEQAGSFGTTRTTFDLTGPLTADKTWLYRVNGDFTHANSFVDFVSSQNIFIAPTITYHPLEQFRLNVDVMYQHETLVDDTVFPAVGNRPAPIPISRYLQDPSLTATYPTRMDNRYVGYDWTYDITPAWSLTNRAYYQDSGFTSSETPISVIPAFAFNQVTGAARLSPYYGTFTQRTFATNLDLKGKFDTGPLKHSVLLGTDYFNTANPPFGLHLNSTTTKSTNIYFPTYGQVVVPSVLPNVAAMNTENWNGVYLQDMISTASDMVHVLLGGRYDWAETGGSFVGPVFAGALPTSLSAQTAYRSRSDQAFSPRLGVVIQPLPWLSFYGNFAQSFGTNLGQDVNSSPLAPSKATQWEGGAKAEFLDKRLSASLAFYDIVKTNIATPDPIITGKYDVIGAAESKGVELDLTGRVTENWSVIANFTHDEVRVITASNYNAATEITTENAVIGNRLPSVPANAGNLWVKYDADGQFRGLSIGSGLNVVGSSQGDNANSFQLPQYTLVNGMISYRFPWAGANFTAQLNVKNIFDTTYYAASTDRYHILRGTPRTILASLRVEF